MKLVKRLLLLAILVGIALGGTYYWMMGGIKPTAAGQPFYVRWEAQQSIQSVLSELKERKVVSNPTAMRAYGWWKKKPALVKSGTYKLKPGMTADELYAALAKPVRQMVRIPETNWSMRTAKLLAQDKYNVCQEQEYLELVRKPQEFQEYVDFPLPKTGTLEGYLYPDTYDLPPLLGAKGVIVRQLRAFEQKAWPLLKGQKDPYRTLKVASLVELEVANDKERPIVAGVIENRLKKDMKLDIDAAVMYGIGTWGGLTGSKIRESDTPYNLYKVKGLPPTPICSPSAKSIKGALNPAKHNYYFYVVSGREDNSHRFATTYAQHLQNIRIWRQAEANKAQ